jgi:protein SCO1/2
MNTPTERPQQEHRDVNVRGVALVALGILATVLIVAGIAHFLTGVSGPARAGPTATSIERPKWLASDPEEQRADFDREKDARLNSYGWVDRAKGVAHLPIERAMQIRAGNNTRSDTSAPDIGWTQRIGAALPLQLAFFDENQQRVRLRDYFHDVPVVMVFAYLSCSRLCPEVLTGVDEALRATGLSRGRDYSLLVLSIDPRDTHRPLQRNAHFLTSPDGAASQVAAAAGFRYVQGDETQFGHAAGFLVATPQGTISRYFLGVRYPADEVKAALLAARENKAGSLAERLLLLCYSSDSTHSARSAYILAALRVIAVVGLLLAALFAWRRHGRQQ